MPNERGIKDDAQAQYLAIRLISWLRDGIGDFEKKEIVRMAAFLPRTEYLDHRKAIAKKLEWPPSELDKLVRSIEVKATFEPALAERAEVRDQIVGLLDGEPKEADKKLAETMIWEWINANHLTFLVGGIGYLIYCGSGELHREGIPIAVRKDDQRFNMLLISLGVHPGSPTRDRIGKFIGTMVADSGLKTEAHVSFYYDVKRRTAYFAEQRGMLIKVTADRIERIENGAAIEEMNPDGDPTEKILFLFDDNYEPWDATKLLVSLNHQHEDGEPRSEIDDDPYSLDFCPSDSALLPQLLFDVLEFENEVLGRDDIQILLTAYVTALFLPGIITGKLLLQVLGKTGSAKTLFCRMLGRLIYGTRFEVTGLGDKEDQIENALVNSSFVVFDDIKKTTNEAILGMIRRASTGGSVKRRELYSTFKQVEEPYRASVAITCSEEPFNASDEMSNRSLVIHAKSREDYVREEKLIRQIDENRDALMSEMLVRAKAVILAVSAQRNYEPAVKMRMASFVTLLLQVARHNDWEVSAKEVLEAWRQEQEGATLDPTITIALDAWMATPGYNPDVRYDAHELYQELARVTASLGTTPWWLGKENWLVRALRNASRAYRRYYGFEYSGRTSGHKGSEYWFDPKLKEDPRASAPPKPGSMTRSNAPF